MNRIILAFVIFVTFGCKSPNCAIQVPNIKQQQRLWFNAKVDDSRNYFSYQNVGNFKRPDVKIYFTNIDLSLLDSASDCVKIRSNTIALFDIEKFGSQATGSITAVTTERDAELIAYAKLVKIEERPGWIKKIFLTPVQNKNLGGWWVKLVNSKSKETVFTYYSYSWPIETKDDLSEQYKILYSAIKSSITVE